MSTLYPPFDQLALGVHKLQAWTVFLWSDAGSCDVTTNGDFDFTANVSYNVFGQSGSYVISISLIDHDPHSASGPCIVDLNGKQSTGTYQRNGQILVLSDPDRRVKCSADAGNSAVILELSGYPKVRII